MDKDRFENSDVGMNATEYRTADVLPPMASAGTAASSTMRAFSTVVVRALKGTTVIVPYDVDREQVRRANRAINRGTKISDNDDTR